MFTINGEPWQYLGIPLLAGIVTRFAMLRATSRAFFETRFLPYFSPLALLGLLYTIVVMFAYQGHHIVHNLGPVFRVFVPLVLHFVVMWSAAFALVWWCARRARVRGGSDRSGGCGEGMREGEREPESQGVKGVEWTYEMAVVQSFTAASNNFVSGVLFARRRGRSNSQHDVARTGTRYRGDYRGVRRWV